MKKFTAILVAIVLALFVASCGGSSSNNDNSDSGSDTTDSETPDGDETDSGSEEDSCTIDASFNNSVYDKYVLISGAGTLGDPEDSSLKAADLMKLSFYDENNTDLSFGSPYLFAADFSEYGYGMGIVVQGSATSYMDQTYGIFYGVDASAYIFQSDLDEVESGEIGDFAPYISVGTELAYYNRTTSLYYTKSCEIGMNASEDGTTAAGRFQYCMSEDSIAIGQKVKLGIDAAVYNDPEGIEEAMEAQKADVCSCRKCEVQGQMLANCDNKWACPEDFCEVIDCGEDAVCEKTDNNLAGYFCKAVCDPESEVYNETKNSCDCAEGYEKDKKTKKCVLKDACSGVTCETAGDVCVVDATDTAKGYRCEPKKECKAEENLVLNEKTNTCECKEGFMEEGDKCVKDPCFKNECKAEEFCRIDATVENKGYKCEPKAECKEEDHKVLNEKTNKCDCKEGFEPNDNGACVKETEEPDNEEPDNEEPDNEEPDNEEPDNEEPDNEEPDNEIPDFDEECVADSDCGEEDDVRCIGGMCAKLVQPTK